MNPKSMHRSLAALAAAAFVVFAALPQFAVAGGDGTIGTLPSADGGDGTQNFFVTGPRQWIGDAIQGASGRGYFVPVDLPGDAVWIEFYGDVDLTLDEVFLLQHPEIEIGLTAGFAGAGMLVKPEVGGHLSGRELLVGVGMSLPTPLARIHDLVEDGLVLHTGQLVQRTLVDVAYEVGGGQLRIRQQRK